MAQTTRGSKTSRTGKSFSQLAPTTQRRYMRVLGVDTPTQADRILRDMQRRGVSRKRLRGHAPQSAAKRAPQQTTRTIPINELRRRAALHIARELDRPDAIVMLTLHSVAFDRPSALRALKMSDGEIRSAAADAPSYDIEDVGLVNPFWYHPTPYAW